MAKQYNPNFTNDSSLMILRLSSQIRRHVEARHLGLLDNNCDICNKLDVKLQQLKEKVQKGESL